MVGGHEIEDSNTGFLMEFTAKMEETTSIPGRMLDFGFDKPTPYISPGVLNFLQLVPAEPNFKDKSIVEVQFKERVEESTSIPGRMLNSGFDEFTPHLSPGFFNFLSPTETNFKAKSSLEMLFTANMYGYTDAHVPLMIQFAVGLWLSQNWILCNLHLRSVFYRQNSTPPFHIFIGYGTSSFRDKGISKSHRSALRLLLIVSGNIELNPGPDQDRDQQTATRASQRLRIAKSGLLDQDDIVDDDFVYVIQVPQPPVLRCKICRVAKKTNKALIQHLTKDCLCGDQFTITFCCTKCNRQFEKESVASDHYDKCSPLPVFPISQSSKSNGEIIKSLKATQRTMNFDEKTLMFIGNSGWLNDDIVSFSLMGLCLEVAEEDPVGSVSCSLISSHFPQLLSSFEKGEIATCGQELVGQNSISAKWVLFPLHEGDHWSLILIDNESSRFLHYDSSASAIHRTFAKHTCDVLAGFAKERLQTEKFLRYSFECLEGSVQRDGFNCGVYVILTARSYILKHNTGKFDLSDCTKWRHSFVASYRSTRDFVPGSSSARSSVTAKSSPRSSVAVQRDSTSALAPHIATSGTGFAPAAGADLQTVPPAISPLDGSTPLPATTQHRSSKDSLPKSSSAGSTLTTDSSPSSSLAFPRDSTFGLASPNATSSSGASQRTSPFTASPRAASSINSLIGSPSAAVIPQYILATAVSTQAVSPATTPLVVSTPPTSVSFSPTVHSVASLSDPLNAAHSRSQAISQGNPQMTSASSSINAHKCRVKIIHRIPKGSRIAAAKKLSDLIRSALRCKDQLSWNSLFAFAHSCLKVPPVDKAQKKSLASVMNNQIQAFDGSCSCSSAAKASKPNKGKRKHPKLSSLVSKKLSLGDVKGAVRLASSNSPLAPNTEETIKTLKDKHPLPPVDQCLPLPPDPSVRPLQVSEEEIREAINSFNNGSSGGLDGIRPSHIKDLINPKLGQSADLLLTQITNLVNAALRGDLPDCCLSACYGASLCAFSKPNGGVRPIAVGNTFRRIAGKVACKFGLAAVVQDKFRPYQIGCGVKYGAESAAHSLRYFLASAQNRVGATAVVKVDFSNAFNAIRRDRVLEAVKESLPEIYPLTWQAYSRSSNLYFEDTKILSCSGVQQGDPLGPLLFCLGANPVVQSCTSRFNCWYLDDGTLGGTADEVIRDFNRIKDSATQTGLQINSGKCEYFVTGGTDAERSEVSRRVEAAVPGIKRLSIDSLTLLGAPISLDSIDGVLAQKLLELKNLCKKLACIDQHDALYLLRHCFAMPKLMYTLRTAPCFHSRLLESYDDLLRATLSSLLNIKVEDRQWTQASLPIRHGGLGIRSACDLALPAFISSCVASKSISERTLKEDLKSLPGLTNAKQLWERKIQNAATSDSIKNPIFQRSWDDPICKMRSFGLLSSAKSDFEKASLLAAASQHSGSWLNALPVPSLGLKLDPSTLRIAVSLRLGVPVSRPHVCRQCGESVSGNCAHGLSCRKSAGRQFRHNTVNNLICRALISAGIPSRQEPQGMMAADQKRPDGTTLIPWSKGKALAWDFTCSDTLASSHLHRSSIEAGKIAETAECGKVSKYSDLSPSTIFQPVCIETLGVWGSGAKGFITAIGRKIQSETGDKRATEFLIQSIGLAVQRGNALSIMGSLPDQPSLDSLEET